MIPLPTLRDHPVQTFQKAILCFITCSCLAVAEEESWWEIPSDPTPVTMPSATGGTRGILYSDTATQSSFQAVILPAPSELLPFPTEGTHQEVIKRSEELKKLADSSPALNLTIDWLAGDGQPSKESHEIHLKDGRIRNTYRIRSTTIIRDLLVADDGTAFIHFHADQPGALSFKVSLSASTPFETKIEDRRQIILTPADPVASPRSHLWVIPFESDVATEGTSISVRGEGEALIIWNFAPGKTAAATLAGTVEALGKIYDPGDIPANPSLIWNGVLEKHVKSAKNSP